MSVSDTKDRNTDKPLISIGIPVYAQEKFDSFFPLLIGCLKRQTIQDFEILVHDTADGRFEKVIKDNWEEVKYETSENIGFGASHNRMISRSKGEFYLCANPSQVFTDDYLEQLLTAVKKTEKYACAVGKTMRLSANLPKQICKDFFDKKSHKKEIDLAEKILEKLQNKKSHIIDTVGTQILPDLRSINIGEGETDKGQFDRSMKVIGGSGCSILFKRSTLEKVKVGKGEYFDEMMWMYKEDEELELRLALAGFVGVYMPQAQNWYYRTADNIRGNNWLSSGLNRLLRSSKSVNKLYSSLHYDYILGKYFDSNKEKFPGDIRRKIEIMRIIRHLWEFVLENNLWRRKKELWTKYEKALKEKKFVNIDPVPIISWIRNPRRPMLERQKQIPKLSISTLGFDLNNPKQFKRLRDEFFPRLLDSKLNWKVEMFFVLNEEESVNFRKLEREFGTQTKNKNIKIHFIRQGKLRVYRGMTAYITPHNLAQNQLARGEFRMLLNEDIDLKPDTLKRLIDFMESDSGIGIMAPRVQYPNGKIEPMARRFPHLMTLITNRLKILQKLFPEVHRYYLRADEGIRKPVETDWVCGHLFVVREETWKKIGGKDERFFAFMSDTDICREAWCLGWEVVYNPEITVQNVRLLSSHGGLLKFFASKRMQVHLRDALLYFQKWRKKDKKTRLKK